MIRRFVAILNPISGRRNMLARVRGVQCALRRSGAELDIFVTERAGHATQIAAGLNGAAEAVLVVGGDGTVCEVANGLAGTDTPMVIFRTGTENLLARELGMPTGLRAIADTLLHGERMPADAGSANGRRFLAIAGVGFDAECVRRMSQVRRGHITHLDYFWPIWRTFWEHRFPELRVEADGAEVFQGRGLALIGVIPRYSVGLRILARARIDDGLLDLAVFPCRTRRQLLGHACRAFARRHVGRGGVIYRQCRQLRITSPQAVPIETDGESAGELPVEFQVVPSAATYLKPRRERSWKPGARTSHTR